jgi:hypothetical protein
MKQANLMTDHNITPPPELVQEWVDLLPQGSMKAFTAAAQWGADQELQACINFVYDNELCDPDFYNNLRTARRPKPPSLKEQAIQTLELITPFIDSAHKREEADIIRRALEQLND